MLSYDILMLCAKIVHYSPGGAIVVKGRAGLCMPYCNRSRSHTACFWVSKKVPS